MSHHLPKEERQRQLLEAAIVCFGEKGYHRTQVSDIIARAHVARGTFYLYFEGKREIFDVLITELFQRVQSEIRTLPRDAVDKIPSQLMGNIQRVTGLLVQQPLLAKILFNESVGLDKELDERLKIFYGQILDLIQRGLRQGQEMGFVREGDIRVLSICLLGCLKEIFYQSLLEGGGKSNSSAVTREVFRLVIHAIAKPELIATLEKTL
ncbi:MAG: TetR/AcrR family transcriptional regulator [Deltaproteobacteria bacterium]|nr:TetR/AcrR family transcriptional regulator [Deltaproteobacteria bacterium]